MKPLWMHERVEMDVKYGKVPKTHSEWADAMMEAGARQLMSYLPVKGWLLFDGKGWGYDPEGKGTGDIIRQFACAYREAPTHADPDMMAKAFSLQQKAEADGHITAVQNVLTKILKSDIESLDADEWLLNTPSGVLDLRTRELSLHSPKFRMTMATRGSYKPEALAHSRWLRAIEETIPDTERRAYLQEMTGLALIGKQLEQIAILMYGPTARNGKSTIGEAIQYALGSYSGVGDPSILTNADKHPENLAALFGKRMVAFSELPEDKVLAASGFKRLTGDDTITARFLFRDRFEYKPEFMIMIRANDLPYVPGDDEGTWRRLKVVLFDQQFSGTADDRYLRQELIEPAEADAVLTWAVEGLARYLNRPRQKRYWEPQCVQNDTQELRDSLDPVGQFLREQLEEADAQAFVSYKDIHFRYAAWGQSQALKHLLAQRTLTTKIRKRPGLLARHHKHNGIDGLKGMRLRPAETPGPSK